MPSIRDIQTEAQEVVRFSTGGLNTLNKLKLDEITYNILDKDGAVVTSFTGRDNRQAAYDDADTRNAADPRDEKYPFRVDAKSNLGIDPDTGALDFVTGSQIGILFPTEEIKAAAASMEAAVDCEIIEEIIKREIQALIDQLKTKATAAGDVSPFSALASIPSNPLKIISWVRKFVSMYLGPQMLALVDLAIQLAQLAQAINDITQASIRAQQNVRLCAASALDTAIDSLIESGLEAVGTSEAEINAALTKIADVERQISGITGKPTKFNTTSIDALIASATAENKAAFLSDVNEYATASLSEAESSLSANAISSISTSLSGDSAFATSSLASAGAVTAQQQFTVDGTTFTFENGILTAVA